MGIRVGIDLGTCYSSLAYVDQKTEELIIIPNEEEELKTPSLVLAFPDKTTLFGQEALDKRLAGEGEVTEPSTAYLQYLLQMAKKKVGQDITEAVITVPSFYTDGERRNLKEMLSEAGVHVIGILNEPTAAALAYSYRNPDCKKLVLIYKLGGGSFEAAVAEIKMNQVQILGTTGSRDLGGKEWEDVIATYIQDQFFRDYRIDFTEDKGESIRIRTLAEQIKIRLSQVSSADAIIHYKGYSAKYTITREMLGQMTQTILTLTSKLVIKLLDSLSINKTQLDGILFSGGGTKMPMVKDHLRKVIGRDAILGVNTDYDVVFGAAIMARLWDGKKEGFDSIHEVVSNSLGMISVSVDGAWYVNSIMIHKNSRIPVSNTRTFRLPSHKEGGRMVIFLLQGEAAIPKDCTVVGKYVIDRIYPTTEDMVYIEVTFTYDADGIIHIQARQKNTKEELSIKKEPIPLDMEWVNSQPKVVKEDIATQEEGLVYLCVDLSGSMAGVTFVEAKRALRRLAEELDLKSKRVGIIGFADQSQLILPPTENLNNIIRTLQRLHISGRMFGYGNGTSPFAQVYEKHCQDELKEEVTMVVVTDGAWPDKERALQVANLCKEKGVSIYTMGFGRADMDYLKRLSSLKELSDFANKRRDKGEWLSIAQIVLEDKSE